jgi:hypothetical protein
MARVSFIALVRSSLQLVLGFSDPKIAAPLMTYGLSPAVIDQGWELIYAFTRMRGRVMPQAEPNLIREIDALENHWFPIARHVLGNRFPEMGSLLFDGLRQTSGREVILSADLFVTRIQKMGEGEEPYGEVGVAARKALAERGLTDAILGSFRDLIERVGILQELPPPPVDAHERAEAIAALEAWYREWSGIARVVITNRAHLRTLGLRTTRRTAASSVVEEAPEQVATPVATPVAAPPSPSPAADASPEPGPGVRATYAPWFAEGGPPASAE